ncbi:MAG TPA: polysaccharide biosynthesis protein [Anaerolineae bacterium]|nr:polysaccharide biosynthesis protein [Anaerolineae bacterium]
MGIARHLKQLGGEIAIYGVFGTISRAINVFLVPVYTRAFSPADYGIVALITTSLGLLSTVFVLGLDNASARWYYDSEEVGQRKSVISGWFWCQFAVSLLATLIVTIFAPSIAQLLFDSADLAHIVRIAIWLLPLGTFGRVVGNWLRYQRRAVLTTIFFTAVSIATIGLVILFVVIWQRGLEGLYWGHVSAGLLTAGGAVLILRAWISPRNLSWKTLKAMLRFGAPLAVAAIASWIVASSDRFYLQYFFGLDEVGIYAIAVAYASVVGLLTGAFQMAWGPFALSILHESNARNVYGRVLSIYALVGGLVGAALSLFSPYILRVFTTPPYYPAASNIPWLIFSNLAIGTTYIAVLGTTITKKSTPIAASIIIASILNTALNFLLIPPLGRNGAAIATFLAYLVQLGYLFHVSQKMYRIPYKMRDAIICVGFAWALIGIDHVFLPSLGWTSFLIRLGLCLLFLPLAFMLGIVKPEHIQHTLHAILHRDGSTDS